MRPRDWFAVGVRLLGVYVFYRSVGQWLGLLADRFYEASRSELARDVGNAEARTGYTLVYAVGYLALSYVLVFGAERLTRWAFGESFDSDNGQSNKDAGVG